MGDGGCEHIRVSYLSKIPTVSHGQTLREEITQTPISMTGISPDAAV